MITHFMYNKLYAQVYLYYVPAGATVQNSGFDGANETILIWYDSIQCRGNEARLVDCIVSEPRLHNCDHSQDVGVRCGKTSMQIVMWFTYIIASLSSPAGSSLYSILTFCTLNYAKIILTSLTIQLLHVKMVISDCREPTPLFTVVWRSAMMGYGEQFAITYGAQWMPR